MRSLQTVLLALAAVILHTQQLSARKWTDTTGRFSVEAEFVSRQGDTVVLRKQDGQEIAVPWSKLSPSDQEYVKSAKLSPPPSQKPAIGDRATLIKAMVERGDAAPMERKRTVYYFAMRYAPEDKSILEKYSKLNDVSSKGTQAHYDFMVFASKVLLSQDVVDWPRAAAETDIIEMQMLLDSKLTGNLQHTYLKFDDEEESVIVFLSPPERKISEVISMYGRPKPMKSRNNGRVLCYGRIRILADSAGKVLVVVMSPR